MFLNFFIPAVLSSLPVSMFWQWGSRRAGSGIHTTDFQRYTCYDHEYVYLLT